MLLLYSKVKENQTAKSKIIKLRLPATCYLLPKDATNSSHTSRSFKKFLAASIFTCLLFSCSIPDLNLTKNEPLPEGMGAVSLRILGGATRTILPDKQEFAFYRIIFTAVGTGEDRTVTFANPGNGENVLPAVILAAGTYNITVNAYYAGTNDVPLNPGANGSLAEPVLINPGTEISRSITLKLTGVGTGIFDWKIDISASDVTSAKMTLFQNGAEVSDHTLNNSGDTLDNNHSLPAGVYNVLFELIRPNGRAVWYELLYIYDFLTSRFEKEFNNDFFHRTHYIVTFDENHDEGDIYPHYQSVIHGGLIDDDPNPENHLPPPVRNDHFFAGWYTDKDCTEGNKWNLANDPVINDITLYAKWISGQAFTLSFEQITEKAPDLPVTGPVIFLTANGPLEPSTATIAVSEPERFSKIQWYCSSVLLNTSGNDNQPVLLLDSSNPLYNNPGKHFLTVEVQTTDGAWYSRVITFTVKDTTVWVSTQGSDQNVPYDDLSSALASITGAGTYTVRLGREQRLAGHAAADLTRENFLNITGTNITLEPASPEEIMISLSSNGRMFTVASGVTLTLNDGITLVGRRVGGNGNVNNNAPMVEVSAGGTFIMNGAVINGNNGGNSTGGVSVRGTFTMNSGIISNNSVGEWGTGGGVSLISNGIFNMNGGYITGNYSSGAGGGINAQESTVIMSGGVISGNTAGSSGGGINISTASLFISGGIVSGNTAGNNGGGVSFNNGTFYLGGTAKIYGNTKTGYANNVYLVNGYYIILGTGGVTIPPPAPGMEVYVQTATPTGIIVGNGASPIHAGYFRADEAGRQVVFQEPGRLVIE